MDENHVKNYDFTTLVSISGDPHDYEPTTTEVKNLIKAEILISGPTELNPWVKKINYQRSKISNVKSVNVQIDKKDYAQYPGGTHEALSHFWLYPKIFCSLKTRLEEELVASKILSASSEKKSCSEAALKIENELRETMTNINIPVVLTHDALLPLLESLTKTPSEVVAIKGSGHHHEASPRAVKKLYDALKKPKVIWVEETGINVPANIMAKKRPVDLTIKIDTAKTEGMEYFQILQAFNEKLKALAGRI